MREERLLILKMLEEGKISAVEAEALIAALDETETETVYEAEYSAADQAGQATEEDWRTDEDDDRRDDDASSYSDFTRELKEQIRDAVKAAMRNMPEVKEDLRENLSDVRKEVGNVVREVQEEMRKGPLIDLSGLRGLVSNLRSGFGPTREFTQTVQGAWVGGVEAPRVTLTTRNGSLTVKAWDRDEYKVHIVKRIHSASEENARRIAENLVQVTTDDTSGLLEVRTQEGGNASVSLDVYLPKKLRYELEASTRNGSVDLEGLRASVAKGRTTNGAVRVERVTANDLTVETTNGKIVCDDVDVGKARARTTNGGITWEGVAVGAELETTNGSVRLKPEFPEMPSTSDEATDVQEGQGEAKVWPAVECRYEVRTTNAAIRAEIPWRKGTGVRFDAKGGHVKVEEAEEHYQLNHHGGKNPSRHVSGVSRGFDEADRRMELTLHTTNGYVRLEHSE